jgi:outer membrane receptor protein involved in Fe transport
MGSSVRLSATAVTLLLSTVALPALAWAAPDPAPGDDMIQEIIVTAQKRSERLRDVPMTVSVVNTKALVEQNQTQFKDYLVKVPGVSLQENGPGLSIITIRGISSTTGNPLVGFTIDDVPLGASTYLALGSNLHPDLDPADLSSIEVLQGPQGTLYGAASMGGLIKYQTSAPSLTETTGRIQADGSTAAHGNGGYGLRGAIGTPIAVDKAGVQLSGFYRQDPGFADDPSQGRKNINENRVYGVRLALAANLTDRLKVRGSALYQNAKSDGSATVDVDAKLTPITGPYQYSRVPGTDGYQTKLQFYNGVIDYDLGFATLSSLTGYSVTTFFGPRDFTPRYAFFGPLFYGQDIGVGFNNTADNKKFSEELRLVSNTAGPLSYIAGLFYDHEKTQLVQDLVPIDPISGKALPLDTLLNAVIPTTYDEYAAFVSLTYKLNERFDVQAGGRLSQNKQKFSETDNGLLGGGAVSEGTSKETPFTYSVSPRWHLDDQTMVYGRLSTGYRPGGPNASPPPGVQRQFGSDKTKNYELGVKTALLDNRLQANLAAFYIDWKGIQASLTDPDTGFNFTTNEGNARSKGVQGDVQYAPIHGLTFAGSFAYTDAYLTQDSGASSNAYASKGDKLPSVPKWSGTLTGDYRWDLSDTVTPFVGATVAYTGARYTDFVSDAASPRIKLPSFTTVDLRAGFTFETLTATAFVKNVGDSRGYTGMYVVGSGGPYALSMINPRTIGLSVAKTF